MIFNSFNFIIIFPLLFSLYYLIPVKFQSVRNTFLLLTSYILYMNFKPIYALILLYVTIITYIAAIWVERKKQKSRHTCKFIFILLSLSPLIFFKYYNFINESCLELLSIVGLNFYLPGLNWAIPVGISFFTFQALGYLGDVFMGRIKAEKNFLHYALFVSFFPSIVSGPINKASLLLPQIKSPRPYFDYNKAVEGLKFLLWGMFMKVVIADRLAIYVDTVLSNYHAYNSNTCLVSALLYSIQIYTDFAGYSFMAIGIGKILGFELTENFRRPYFAISITDFWRRWHISLSTWLKDYIYIPLGGNRCSKLRNYANIMTTFLVSGIWHGANWTFIVWGILHGIFQIIEKALGFQKCNHTGWIKGCRIFITFILITIAWVFFRMPTLNDGIRYIIRMFNYSLIGPLYISNNTHTLFIIMGVVIIFTKDILDEFFPQKKHLLNNKHKAVRWLTYLGIMILIIMTGVFDAGQFIYANF